MNEFNVLCCGRRRGVFPRGVLVCQRCDYTSPTMVLPNENQVEDVPLGVKTWEVPRVEGA